MLFCPWNLFAHSHVLSAMRTSPFYTTSVNGQRYLGRFRDSEPARTETASFFARFPTMRLQTNQVTLAEEEGFEPPSELPR